MTFKISCFNNQTDKQPKLETFETWPLLVDRILAIDAQNPWGRHIVTKNKDGLGFSPATFLPGTTQATDNVDFVYFATLDVDHKTDEQIAQIRRVIEENDLIWVSYTSHSHNPPEDNRLRFLIPFDRPVPNEQWGAVWAALNGMFLGLTDRACKNSDRMYFFPACPKEGLAIAGMAWDHDGVPLCVDEMLGTSSGAIHVPLTSVITSVEARALAAKLKKKGGGLKPVGEALASVARGEVYAEKGGRDTLLFQMVNALAEAYPHASRTSLVMLFVGSVSAMSSQDDPITMAMVEAKVVRALEVVAHAKREAETQEAIARGELIQQAFRSVTPGRNTPYTKSELDAFQTFFPSGKIKWILQKRLSYYVFFNGAYRGPYIDKEVGNVARVLLSPAPTNVQTEEVNNVGTKKIKNPSDLIKTCGGEVISRVEASLFEQSTKYVEDTLTLVEAPCPLRYTEPVFSVEIDDWLRVMVGAGKDYDALTQWLSCVPELSQRLSLLYLDGDGGTGKTLLGQCLASLWADMPTNVKSVVGTSFNTELSRCPLILADESFPPGALADLREMLSAPKHTLRRKFQDEVTLHGHLRMIVAANNPDVLSSSKENLNNRDIESVRQRTLYLQTNVEAKEYLEGLGDLVDTWKRGPFARHVMWLEQNIKPTFKRDRFGVSGGLADLGKSLMVGTGLRPALLQWILSWLDNPSKLTARNQHTPITVHTNRRGERAVWANGHILDCWGAYGNDKRLPERLGDTLVMISPGVKGTRQNFKGKLGHCYKIDTEQLITQAERSVTGTRETVIASIAQIAAKNKGEDLDLPETELEHEPLEKRN